MDEVKHIPPPWIANGMMIDWFDAEGNRLTVATVNSPWWLGEQALEVRLANARLIAAAPELLEALERLVNAAAEYMNGASVMRAEAAIAKAKGDVDVR